MGSDRIPKVDQKRRLVKNGRMGRRLIRIGGRAGQNTAGQNTAGQNTEEGLVKIRGWSKYGGRAGQNTSTDS